MKTIAQILVSAALGASLTFGFSKDARQKVAQVVQHAENFVSRTTNDAVQTASNTAYAEAQTSVDANAGTQSTVSAKAQTSTFAQGSGNTGAAENGSSFNFLFGGQSGLNLNFGFGQ